MPGVDYLAYDFDSGLQKNNALAMTGFDSDLGFGVDEVFLGPGDSGSPNFINGLIAAVTSFRNQLPSADATREPDSSWGETGFDVRVAQFREFLEDATGGRSDVCSRR